MHSSVSIHSSDSIHSVSGDDSVDFEGGDDSSDNGGEPAESSESPLLRYRGLPIDVQTASAVTMTALSCLGHPERQRAYDDPGSE